MRPIHVKGLAVSVFSGSVESSVRRGDRRKSASIAAYNCVRLSVSKLFDVRSSEVEFARLPNPVTGRIVDGKPILRYPPDGPSFSISHSSNRWIVAISQYPVGIDIQRISPVNLSLVGPQCLSNHEVGALEKLSLSAKRRLFFRIWSRKEAIVKATGHGLLAGLTRIETHPEIGPDVRFRSAYPRDFFGTLTDIVINEDFSCAAAVLDDEKIGLVN